MRAIKKRVEVDVFQMTKARRWDNSEWPDWLNWAWNLPAGDIGRLYIDDCDPDREKLVIATLEGVMRVSWDDWIIRGTAGELYTCKPDIFQTVYDLVRE